MTREMGMWIMIPLLSVTVAPAASAAPNQSQPSRSLNTFTFDCTTREALKAAHLEEAARQALDNLGDGGTASWADRAIVADLNNDGTPEVFVPLSCGATCNCTWAIFQQAPSQLLGIIGGCILHIQRANSPWSTVLAYSHMSAGDGFLQTYFMDKGSYRGGPLSEVTWSEAAPKVGCEHLEQCCNQAGSPTSP